jgi:hypothetical protein
MQFFSKSYETIPESLKLEQREGGCFRYHKRASGLFCTYYGVHHTAKDDSQRSSEYLGKVIEKDNHIFYNNKWGFFKFSIENGYEQLNNNFSVVQEGAIDFCNLRYGDIWLLTDLYNSSQFESVITSISPFDSDTLHALIAYKLSTGDNAFVNVEGWFQRSYAKILYPNAALSSGSISTFLKRFGGKNIREKFFDFYHEFLNEDKQSDVLICNSVLIDSTGAQNDIKIPLTAISNHNGNINNEFRVIYVVDHERELPIYMDEVPGNIVDVSTLKYIINILRYRRISVKCCVLDAGYYTEENLDYLDSIDINYLVRMCNNRKLYKNLIEKDSQDLAFNVKYRILYRKRYLHCKKIILKNTSKAHFAYIVLDFEKEQIDRNVAYSKYTDDKEISDKSLYFGKFILFSNFDIDESEVLNFYYTREHIEQVFDISKNNGSMLPLRTHSTETTMGHLLLSFISTIISLFINNKLKNTKYCASSVLNIMKNLSVYVKDKDSQVEPLMPMEKEIAILLGLNLEYPLKVDLSKEYTNNYLRKISSLRKRGRPKGRKNRGFLVTKKVDSKNGQLNEDILQDNNTDNSNLNMIRKPGRPKGSKNKQSQTSSPHDSLNNKANRKPGRPKGSKNK